MFHHADSWKLPTFSSIMVPSSSNMGIHSYLPATITHFGLLDPENEGTMMLWNGSKYLPIAMVQHASRLESWGTTLLSQAQ